MATTNVENMLKRFEEGRKRELALFMDAPATKLLISMVPPSNPPELLATLLQAAYERGFEVGVSSIAIPIMESHAKRD